MTKQKWTKEEQEMEMKLRHEWRKRRKEALEALEKELEKEENESTDPGLRGDDL